MEINDYEMAHFRNLPALYDVGAEKREEAFLDVISIPNAD